MSPAVAESERRMRFLFTQWFDEVKGSRVKNRTRICSNSEKQQRNRITIKLELFVSKMSQLLPPILPFVGTYSTRGRWWWLDNKKVELDLAKSVEKKEILLSSKVCSLSEFWPEGRNGDINDSNLVCNWFSNHEWRDIGWKIHLFPIMSSSLCYRFVFVGNAMGSIAPFLNQICQF